MLKLIPHADAERLRELFQEAGYSEANLKNLGFRDLPSSRLRNFARLFDKTRESNRLNTLLRWFWIGAPQSRSDAEKYILPEFVQLFLISGLLSEQDSLLLPQAMLMEANGFLIASDYPNKIDRGDAELVLWPNPTSRLLLRMTIRRPSDNTLDLGTGTGIEAIAAASHSRRVIATDLSPRAVEFAAFNARLNGIDNMEVLVGDGFQPVVGQGFDLIVCNPPFFISPSSRYLFCNNHMQLDLLCRQLVREAPNHLNEDGYFEMLCEWAQVKGQSWEERIGEWLDNTGCDAWVMKAYTRDPGEYAEEQIRATVATPERDSELFAEYMAYYRECQVDLIHGGTIIMRRRTGRNWIVMDEISQMPKEPFGESILRAFAAQDFLQRHTSDEQLLGIKPKLSSNVCLEQILQQESAQWKRISLSLKLVSGFSFSVGLQPLVAEFLSACDGTRSLGDLIQALAGKVNAPTDQVRLECAQVVRKLIERGFLAF